jgi:spore maturation protein SpmA
MLNYLWLGLIVAAVVIGGVNGSLKAVSDKAFEMAKFAVLDTALPLVGIMALWLGIMRLAERAGLVSLLAQALRPLLRLLFPDVPAGHPAMGSMLMNLAANMLGLGNAATPLGLRAMQDLERLNPHPGTATNAMCTFLALNTSSVTLIPVTAVAILAANNSANPTAIVGTAFFASVIGAITGVSMARFCARLPWFRAPAVTAALPVSSEDRQPESLPPVPETPVLQPLRWWSVVVLAAFVGFAGWLFLRMAFPEFLDFAAATGSAGQGIFVRIIDALSRLSVPLMLCGFPLYAALRGVKVYEEFIEGAKEGFNVALRIIPYLVAILVAIGMFRAAGGIDLLSQALAPVLQAVGFPAEALPLALLRPLSGSGTLGLFAELVKTHGPDSFLARLGGTIYGSTETTFYVLAVYFGSVGIKRTRHAVVAGLTADFVAVVASLVVCRLMFPR